MHMVQIESTSWPGACGFLQVLQLPPIEMQLG